MEDVSFIKQKVRHEANVFAENIRRLTERGTITDFEYFSLCSFPKHCGSCKYKPEQCSDIIQYPCNVSHCAVSYETDAVHMPFTCHSQYAEIKDLLKKVKFVHK